MFLSIDYSDSIPDITFTYNRLGQQKSVADAVGSRSSGYNSAFQLTSEAIGGIYNKTINRTYSDSGFKVWSPSTTLEPFKNNLYICPVLVNEFRAVGSLHSRGYAPRCRPPKIKSRSLWQIVKLIYLQLLCDAVVSVTVQHLRMA